MNTRIAAVKDFYICPDLGIAWVPIIAATDIEAPEEIVFDYGKMYWRGRNAELQQIPSPPSPDSRSEIDDDGSDFEPRASTREAV